MLVPNSDSRNTTGPSGAAGEEVVLGLVIGRLRPAEREDADVEDDGEIGEDEDRRDHDARSSGDAAASSRCDGQAAVVRAHISSADSEAESAVVGEADRQEAEDERMRRAPEPDVLVQDVERDNGENECERCDRHVVRSVGLDGPFRGRKTRTYLINARSASVLRAQLAELN